MPLTTMDLEADPLLHDKSKRKSDEDGLYFSEEGLRKGDTPPAEQKGFFKRVIPSLLNCFTFCLASNLMSPSYNDPKADNWSNLLLLWALICYAIGSVLGIGLKFLEGKLLSTYFPKSCGARKFSFQDLQDVGPAGFWHKWVMVLNTCLYVELSGSIVGRLYGLNDTLVQRYPDARAMTISWLTLEPATVLVILFLSVMVLPMWHNTKFDLTWNGLGPLYIANNFPWGFPMYRVIVGILSNFFKLVESHKEHQQAKAAALKQLDS